MKIIRSVSLFKYFLIILLFRSVFLFSEEPDKRRQKRNKLREQHRPLTNQEARQKAQELGYKEDRNPPFNSEGKPTFKNGNTWITPDRTAHKGGVWKVFKKGNRIGTYNIDLTIMIGI